MTEGVSVWVIEEAGRTRYRLEWVDPITGRRRRKSSGVPVGRRREAERAAATWAAYLASANPVPGRSVAWDTMRDRFDREYLPGVAAKTAAHYVTALNALERTMGPPATVDKVDYRFLSLFVTALRKEKLTPASIANYLRGIRVFLRWCKRMGAIREVPDMPMPRIQTGDASGGRALTTAEYRHMLSVIPHVIEGSPDRVRSWTDLVQALWLSGLRIEEVLRLHWAPPATAIPAICPTWDHGHPMLAFGLGSQKSRRVELVPITPDFAAWLLPRRQESGRIVAPLSQRGTPVQADAAKRMVSKIGRAAGILVSPRKGKYATAHDLRRSFGSRWAKHLLPQELMTIMRHTSINTTMTYYISSRATQTAAKLWVGGGLGGDNLPTTEIPQSDDP